MISIHESRELKAAIFALKGMNRELRNTINRETTKTFNPVWKNEVQSRAKTPMDTKVLAKGARISGGTPPTMFSATSKRRMRGGLVPAESWRGFEFGSDSKNNKRTYTGTSPKGKKYEINRRTQRQMPSRNLKGRMVYPAVAEVAPRIASLWVQLVVKKTMDAIEGRE